MDAGQLLQDRQLRVIKLMDMSGEKDRTLGLLEPRRPNQTLQAGVRLINLHLQRSASCSLPAEPFCRLNRPALAAVDFDLRQGVAKRRDSIVRHFRAVEHQRA